MLLLTAALCVALRPSLAAGMNQPGIASQVGMTVTQNVTADQKAPEAHDYKAAWKTIVRDVEQSYYDASKAKSIKDWVAAATPIVEKAKTDAEFDEAVTAFIHKFGDSHFDVYTPGDQGFYLFGDLAQGDKAAKMPNCGGYFFPNPSGKAAGGWLAGFVVNDTTGAKAGLRQGDIVAEADGKPFEPVDSFAGKEGKEVVLTGTRDGKPMTWKVTPSDDLPLDQFLEGTRDSVRIIDQGGFKIGYVHLWTQTDQRFANALSQAVLGKLKGTDALVFDDRDGYGGRPEAYLSPFFLPPVTFQWKGSRFGYSQQLGYSKPMVLLINKYSRSAKEMLSDIFKISGRAVLVGQTTAGNVLGTTPTFVTPWCWLEMPVMDVRVDGQRLEGVGVSPNIVVPSGFDAKGNDITLDAGLAEAVKLATVAKKQK